MESWTLPDLVAEAGVHIARLPAPKNGQVRAVPDERTVRYYATLGLLDRPAAMRGRTALYGRRHLAQVVAIKRLQSAGRSLAEIQAMWPSLDDATLARMTGIEVPRAVHVTKREFWKKAPELAWDAPPWPKAAALDPIARPEMPAAGSVDLAKAVDVPASHDAGRSAATAATAPVELRVTLAPGVTLVLALPEDHLQITTADVRALRAAAKPLMTELERLAIVRDDARAEAKKENL